jgi:hypothetical protein
MFSLPLKNCWQLVLATVEAYSMFWQPSRHGICPTKAVDSMFRQQSWHIPNYGSWQHALARVTAYTLSWLLIACFGNSHDKCLTMGLDSMFWQQSQHMPIHGSWQYVLARVTSYMHVLAVYSHCIYPIVLLTECFGNSHGICPCPTVALDRMCWQQSRHMPNHGSWQHVLATVMTYTQSWLLTACVCNSHDICLTMGLDSIFCHQSWHIPNHN